MFEDCEIIYTYTRKEAIEDGLQFRLGDELAQLAEEAGYKWPVYMTSGVWGLVEMAVNNKKHCNDLNGVLWDIFYMSRVTGQMLNNSLKAFDVIITGTGQRKIHKIYVECGPIDFDNPEPCLTFMLPDEN